MLQVNYTSNALYFRITFDYKILSANCKTSKKSDEKKHNEGNLPGFETHWGSRSRCPVSVLR